MNIGCNYENQELAFYELMDDVFMIFLSSPILNSLTEECMDVLVCIQ